MYRQALTSLGAGFRWVRPYRVLGVVAELGILLRPSSSAPPTWEAARCGEMSMSFESTDRNLTYYLASVDLSSLICKMGIIRPSAKGCVR